MYLSINNWIVSFIILVKLNPRWKQTSAILAYPMYYLMFSSGTNSENIMKQYINIIRIHSLKHSIM